VPAAATTVPTAGADATCGDSSTSTGPNSSESPAGAGISRAESRAATLEAASSHARATAHMHAAPTEMATAATHMHAAATMAAAATTAMLGETR
jgi:hypothetical protein